MLTKTELKIFIHLDEQKTISQIADGLDLSVPTISKYVSLSIDEHNGILQKNKMKRKVFVSRANTTHANLLTSILTEFPRWDVPELFSYSNLKVASIMNDPKRIKDIAFITDLSRQQVKNCLNTLSKVAIVTKKDNKYSLNPSHKLINDFIKTYFANRNENRLKDKTPDGMILWGRGFEYLFKTKKTMNEQKTAVSVFHEYDLPLMSDKTYYFHTGRNLDTEDHILQTILIDQESITYNTYAALLYQKTKPDSLIERAVLYGLEEHVSAMLDLLKTKTPKADYLPPWEEYRTIAEDYGVI